MIVDKARFPRDKCCGDGLTTLALRELEALGLTPSMVPTWNSVDAAWLRSPSAREVRVALPADGVFAAVAPRRELDTAVLQLARDAGAAVHDGHGLTALRQFDGHIDAEVEGLGTVAARYLVAADGMWSTTRKLLQVGDRGRLGEWHAARQYARNITGPAAERLYVWFEPDLLPGYAWSFPLPGLRANVGFCVLRNGERKGHAMNQLWADLFRRPHIAEALGDDVVLEGRHSAWPIPAGIDRATLSRDRTLFAGDAAQAADVLTGEGIGQALLTGRLAAEALLSAGASQPGAARRHYELAVRHHLVADHRLSMLLSRALSHERGARAGVRLLAGSESARRCFARWMFEDEPRTVMFTPSRWHRAFFRRPGAFRAQGATDDRSG